MNFEWTITGFVLLQLKYFALLNVKEVVGFSDKFPVNKKVGCFACNYFKCISQNNQVFCGMGTSSSKIRSHGIKRRIIFRLKVEEGTK